MDFNEMIKRMFTSGKEDKLIPSLPLSMAQPIDGTTVIFWTNSAMKNSNDKTTIENSIIGEYKEGYFIFETDIWPESEIFSWAKYDYNQYNI